MMRAAILAAGAALLIFSNGQFISPFAAIACMPLLLTFANETRPLTGQAILALAFTVTSWVIWWDVIPVPGVLYFIIAAVYGLSHWLPYLVHRLLARRNSFASTLVFPSAYVLVEALLNVATPYGSWSSIAYSQAPASGFAQLAALGGLPLVTFMLAWLGSCLAWAWAARTSVARIGGAAACAALLLAGIAFAPELRARIAGAPDGVVRTVLLTPNPTLHNAVYAALRTQGADSDAAARASAALSADLFQRSAAAAHNGARLIAWSEGAALMLKRDEAHFLEQAAALSRTSNVYLFPAYGALDRPNGRTVLENRVAAIAPDRGVTWIYDKAHPVSGQETQTERTRAPVLSTLDTPFGRVGVAICHDADFPSFIRQASQRRVALLINPASDWPTIQRLHANMAAFRAVENGLTLARPAEGVAEIISPVGATLAQRNSFAGDGLDLTADTPIRRAAVAPLGPSIVVSGAALLMALLMAGALLRKRKPTA